MNPLELNNLFHCFELNLANIVLNVCNAAVCRTSNGLTLNTVRYCEDINYNELITDVLFLHVKYQNYENHNNVFIKREKYELWLNAIKPINKWFFLKGLYQDNKISRAYFFKYALYNYPAPLRELIKYNLFINKTFGDSEQPEKVDVLPLPPSIKADLKLSFSN